MAVTPQTKTDAATFKDIIDRYYGPFSRSRPVTDQELVWAIGQLEKLAEFIDQLGQRYRLFYLDIMNKTESLQHCAQAREIKGY